MSDANIIGTIVFGAIIAAIMLYQFVEHLDAGSPGASVQMADDAFAKAILKQKLRAGEVAVLQVIRQSGNIERTEQYRSVGQALAAARSSFRRAKVDTVRVKRDGEGRLTVYRSWHNHRGRNEGKKFGGVDIQIVDTWTAQERADHETQLAAKREENRQYRASLKARKQEAA